MSAHAAGGRGRLQPLAVPTGMAVLDLLPLLEQSLRGDRPVGAASSWTESLWQCRRPHPQRVETL